MTDQSPAAPRPNVHYPPIPNGLDYLLSVVDHLAGEPGPRDLKYAVLHLQAATEVLLKARLQQEHWSLVLKDPGRADRAKFDKGDFETCGTVDAVKRLRNIVGVDISPKSESAVSELATTRNALQHYGLTASTYAVESRAATVLDFLLDFVNKHLLPELDDEHEAETEKAMDEIAGRLDDIKSFIKTRMDRLRPELQPHANHTVACPTCRKLALVLGTTDDPRHCRFCDSPWSDNHVLALVYVESILGEDPLSDMDQDGIPHTPQVLNCPACGALTLVTGALTAAAPTTPRALCFACGETDQDL